VTNYSDAAARHWNDGKYLHDAARNDNADQLFGFAAECALKSAIVGMSASKDPGEVQKGYRHHIDELWGRAPVQQLSKNFPGLASLLKQPNPFVDWSVDQRYFASGTVNSEQINIHRSMTQRLFSAVHVLGIRRGTK
jgi:hypothetical protein